MARKKSAKKAPGRPAKKKSKAGRPKKTKLPDALAGKFCIAREHLDGHIETWTDGEVFARLDKSLPKFFESKDEAIGYIDSFKDMTPDFSDDSLTPIAVVPLNRFLTHRYLVSINAEGRPEIEISIVVKGQGNLWKEAVEEGKRPLVEQLTAALAEFDAFLKERDAEQQTYEDRVAEAKNAVHDYDLEIKKFG